MYRYLIALLLVSGVVNAQEYVIERGYNNLDPTLSPSEIKRREAIYKNAKRTTTEFARNRPPQIGDKGTLVEHWGRFMKIIDEHSALIWIHWFDEYYGWRTELVKVEGIETVGQTEKIEWDCDLRFQVTKSDPKLLRESKDLLPNNTIQRTILILKCLD